MSEQWRVACWAIGLIWVGGSGVAIMLWLEASDGTPADHRRAMAWISSWPIALAWLAMSAAWSYAAWLVSDLRPTPKPRPLDPRAGYRDSATRGEP
jgi:hypothetical protein